MFKLIIIALVFLVTKTNSKCTSTITIITTTSNICKQLFPSDNSCDEMPCWAYYELAYDCCNNCFCEMLNKTVSVGYCEGATTTTLSTTTSDLCKNDYGNWEGGYCSYKYCEELEESLVDLCCQGICWCKSFNEFAYLSYCKNPPTTTTMTITTTLITTFGIDICKHFGIDDSVCQNIPCEGLDEIGVYFCCNACYCLKFNEFTPVYYCLQPPTTTALMPMPTSTTATWCELFFQYNDCGLDCYVLEEMSTESCCDTCYCSKSNQIVSVGNCYYPTTTIPIITTTFCFWQNGQQNIYGESDANSLRFNIKLADIDTIFIHYGQVIHSMTFFGFENNIAKYKFDHPANDNEDFIEKINLVYALSSVVVYNGKWLNNIQFVFYNTGDLLTNNTDGERIEINTMSLAPNSSDFQIHSFFGTVNPKTNVVTSMGVEYAYQLCSLFRVPTPTLVITTSSIITTTRIITTTICIWQNGQSNKYGENYNTNIYNTQSYLFGGIQKIKIFLDQGLHQIGYSYESNSDNSINYKFESSNNKNEVEIKEIRIYINQPSTVVIKDIPDFWSGFYSLTIKYGYKGEYRSVGETVEINTMPNTISSIYGANLVTSGGIGYPFELCTLYREPIRTQVMTTTPIITAMVTSSGPVTVTTTTTQFI